LNKLLLKIIIQFILFIMNFNDFVKLFLQHNYIDEYYTFTIPNYNVKQSKIVRPICNAPLGIKKN